MQPEYIAAEAIALSVVVRMLAAHLRVNRLDLRLRLRDRRRRRQSSDNRETARVTRFHLIIGERQWLPNFSAPAKLGPVAEVEKLERKIETLRHHSDNGEGFAVEEKLRADDLWVAIEPALP